ncbi:MAG: hypothetical protein ACQCXQ_13280 [Verrucomicrobiales bacterium]|nr:hypothetical protein [Verrucomicrobiota bacterium JB025]
MLAGAAVLLGGMGVRAGAEDVGLRAEVAEGVVNLEWEAVAGRAYAVERSDDLAGPWPEVAVVTPGSAAGMWTDPDGLGAVARFYRLRYDPTDPGQPGSVLFVLPDGDFESGGGVGSMWHEATPLDNAPQLVRNTEGYPVEARSGTGFVWMGGYADLGASPNHQSVIQYKAPIVLPAAPVYLHVWYQVISYEQEPYADVFNLWAADILALGPACQTNLLVSSPPLTVAGNTNGWTRASFDLSLLQGQVICLAFEVRTNFIHHSSLFIDDVSFRDAP